MSDIREIVVELIQRKERDKTRGSWTLAELAANLRLFYSLAAEESGADKTPFVSCAVDEKTIPWYFSKDGKAFPLNVLGVWT